MAINLATTLGPYLRRLGIYTVPVVAASVLGALYARQVGNWPEAGVLGGMFAMVFSVGPALLIVSAVRLERQPRLVATGLLVAAMFTMWVLFAHTTSPKAIAAFLWGPVVGIPAAGVFVVATRRRQALAD